jgi:HK97 family phage major capsid protein
MSFPALKEAQGRLDAKRDEVHGIFNEAGPDLDLSKVKSVSGVSDAKGVAAHIRALNDEMGDLQKEVDDLMAVQKAVEDSTTKSQEQRERGSENGDQPTQRQTKSAGELFVESDAYKRLYSYEGIGRKSRNGATIGPEALLDVELKTVMSTGAGWAPQAIRTDVVIPSAQRPLQVTDLIPSLTTTQASVVFMEETTFTNAAAETLESVQGTPGTYPESALVFTERTSAVRKITTFLPVTDEQLEDIPGAQQYIDSRLPFMVQQRLDGQIVAGDGSSPNLRGLVNVVGISTQAKGTDASPDAILKAIVKVRVTGRATPSGVLIHSTDWQNIRLLKDANGNYIWGSPSTAGPEQIWGLPVAQTETLTAGTAVVADLMRYTALYTRRGLNVQVSNSHSTFFVEGKQAVRADVRVAFVVYRPAAVCTVTGL